MYRCALVIGLTSLTFANAIVACGPELYPRCDDPSHPCPAPPEPLYPKPAPLSSAETAEGCLLACENFRKPTIACPEGNGAVGGEPCATTCVIASRLRPLPLACWIAAKSAVEARACGSLRCVQ